MSLRDEVSGIEAEDRIVQLERQLAKKTALADSRKADLDRLRRREEEQNNEIAILRKQVGMADMVTQAQVDVPKWVKPKAKKKKHVGIPTLMLSDLHLDEVVRPEAIHGWNEYNREIAERRLDRVVNGTVDVAKNYISNIEYEGMVCMLGGDIFSGDIHEELARTNEAPIADSIVHWNGRLASAIEHFADEFGRVFIPAVRGNHDRYGKKKQSKDQSQEAFTWIIYHWLQDHFRDDDRVEFAISPSADYYFNIYDTSFLLTHGDQFRGGSGIAGIYSPIMRGQHKKQMRNSSMDMAFDYVVMGHFHQLIFGNKIIVNGSLKGYDEYAYDNNFEFEKPRQAFWITTPENGVTFPAAIMAE